MTVLSRLRVWLSHGKPQPNTVYAERYAAYQDALRRGDTRDQHDRWLALREAMNARLKAAA
jgi:hypothetical protein